MKKYFYLILALVFISNAAIGQYDAIVDPSGQMGSFTNLSSAINAADITGKSTTNPYRIFVKNGTYYENIIITKKFIQLIGENVAKTIITYDNFSGKPMPEGGTYGTANSATFTINADDFSAANITFENTTGDAPQALAINVSGDRASFKNCRFLGGQDTFLGYNSKYPQSIFNCYIEGVVDFIFGNSKTVFDHCVIYPRDRSNGSSGSYITASNTRESKGLLFRNCSIINNTGVTRYVLGRPWQNDAATTDKATSATIFINTKMGTVVKPEGWSVWDAGTDVNKVIYGEYHSMDLEGNLLDVSARVPWSKQLNETEAAEYLDDNIVFKDRNGDVWDPYSVFIDRDALPSNRLAISNFKYKKSGAELTFSWNLNWSENNVTYKLYRIKDFGTPEIVNTQTISGNDVNIQYAPETGKETVPPAMSTYEYYVVAFSVNGSVQSESIVISAIPVFTLTGQISDFQQGIDKPSAAQLLNLSGEYLPEDVVITAPSPFEVSADNGETWIKDGNPLTLNINDGFLPATTLLVRLNSSQAGSFSGNLNIVSGTGSHNISISLSGTTLNEPLKSSSIIASFSLAQDSAPDFLETGIESATLNLNTYILSDKTSGTNIPYSENYGIQFGPNADGGGWGDNAIKRMEDKSKHIELTLTQSPNFNVTIDSLLFNLAVFNTTGNFAMEYSTDDFENSSLLTNVLLNGTPISASTYGVFTDGTFPLQNQNTGVKRYAVALNGSSGIELQSGQSLKIRFYFRTGSSSSNRYVTLKNLEFKGTAKNALPLRLVSFSGSLEVLGTPRVNLNWTTSDEQNTTNFEIERSSDGSHFYKIGTVLSKNFSGENHYSFTDPNPLEGISFYRLRQNDLDANFTYSKVVVITNKIKPFISLYPNPTSNKITILHPMANKDAMVKIATLHGQVMKVQNLVQGSQLAVIDVGPLPKGSYILIYQNGNELTVTKFIKD